MAHDLLFGHTTTIRDGEVIAFEDLRIEPGAEGPAYVASPNGAPPTRFEFVEAADQTVVFENAAHDFPQRVSYSRIGDKLVAAIAMLDGSRRIEFEMDACSTDGADD